jgi:hypothetical protein
MHEYIIIISLFLEKLFFCLSMLNLSEITLKIRIAAMFVMADLQSMFHAYL